MIFVDFYFLSSCEKNITEYEKIAFAKSFSDRLCVHNSKTNRSAELSRQIASKDIGKHFIRVFIESNIDRKIIENSSFNLLVAGVVVVVVGLGVVVVVRVVVAGLCVVVVVVVGLVVIGARLVVVVVGDLVVVVVCLVVVVVGGLVVVVVRLVVVVVGGLVVVVVRLVVVVVGLVVVVVVVVVVAATQSLQLI